MIIKSILYIRYTGVKCMYIFIKFIYNNSILINSYSSENINSDVLDRLTEHSIPIRNSGLINHGNKSNVTCFYETEEIASIDLQEFLNDISNLSCNFKTLRIEK